MQSEIQVATVSNSSEESDNDNQKDLNGSKSMESITSSPKADIVEAISDDDYEKPQFKADGKEVARNDDDVCFEQSGEEGEINDLEEGELKSDSDDAIPEIKVCVLLYGRKFDPH